MVVAFAFQGLGRATLPLAWMIVRTAGVLAVAVACTRGLGLGEGAVFGAIAAANVVSAGAMATLFLVSQGRVGLPRSAASRATEVAPVGTE